MQKLRMLAYGLTISVGVCAIGTAIALAQVKSQDPRVALADNCDPVTFNAVLGPNSCVGRGDTTFGEFIALLFSPLIKTTVGHPAWRFEPSYLDIHFGQTVRVTNSGGEGHTFTEVAAYGGGFVPILNGSVSPPAPAGTVPLALAPSCSVVPGTPAPGVIVVAPGQTVDVAGLSHGQHAFMCCIHPWMRGVIDVE
jgi:plastocyanin